MTVSLVTGMALGLVAGLGLLLVWRYRPAQRVPSLEARVRPYIADVVGPVDLAEIGPWPAATPFPTLERIIGPLIVRSARRLERILGGAASVQRRLERSGAALTRHQFRVEQVLWGAVGGLVAIGVSVAMIAGGSASSPALLLVFCAAAVVGGVVARDRRLSTAVHRREQRILAEFPTVADMLALAVTAGEGPVAALERVSRTSGGALAAELRRALDDTRAGLGVVQALDRVADRTGLTPLARFVDGIAVAIDRGTPLADVLRSQAADVREAHKRALLEAGARKEISMMVPVVFMVLPVTVVFALYPGLIQISTVVP